MQTDDLPRRADHHGPERRGRDGTSSQSFLFLKLGVGGLLLGGGLFVLVLALAGAPPFDQVQVQAQDQVQAPTGGAGAAPAAPPTEVITGALGDRYQLPPNASAHGHLVDNLFWIISAITGVVFIAVEAVILYFALRYRYRPGRQAVYTHGNRNLEVAWTLTPAVILAVLVFLSYQGWAQIRFGDNPTDATHVEVTGQQFQWNFKMLGTQERFGKATDLVSAAQLHVPLQKPVAIELKSMDVLHSFWVPNMRVKLDAVPGMTGRLSFQPIQAGKYEVVCAELCGAQHFKMRGVLTVDPDEQAFNAWLEEVKIYTPDKPAEAPKQE